MALSIYLDASVLVALFTTDALSARADAMLLATSAPIIVSDFAAAEFASAVGRKYRSRELLESEARRAFSNFDEWMAVRPQIVDLRPGDLQAAAAFMRRLDLSLRTPDAIHVAMAQRVNAALATLDRRMATDAASIGIPIVQV